MNRSQRVTFVTLSSVIALCAAIAVGFGSVRALYYVDVYLPIGNSTGSASPSDSANCYTDPYSWGHSLAYSVESFSNPSRIEFKYIDFYGGWTNSLDPSIDYRFALAYLVHPSDSSQTIPLYDIRLKSFYVYDVTIWLWTYRPHYSWVQAPFALYEGNGQFNGLCSATSYTTFI